MVRPSGACWIILILLFTFAGVSVAAISAGIHERFGGIQKSFVILCASINGFGLRRIGAQRWIAVARMIFALLIAEANITTARKTRYDKAFLRTTADRTHR